MRTYTLHDHVHRNSKINKFYAFVKISRDDRDCRKIHVRSEGALCEPSERASVKNETSQCSNLPKKRRKRRKDDNQPFISRDKDAIGFVSVDITLALAVPFDCFENGRKGWR